MKNLLLTVARNYATTHNTIRYRVELRVIKAIIEDKLNGNLGDSVLDAGAGSGEMGKRLALKGFIKKLTGIEPFHIEPLKENYRSLSGAEAVHGSLEKMPFEDNSFDGVLSTQVFEHIEDHEAAASELGRVIKQGGHALISTPHPPEIYPNPGHVRPGYTESEMVALFQPYGFELVETQYFITLPTLEKLMAVRKLPMGGIYYPSACCDLEKKQSNEERKERQPYGIACLFKKSKQV